MSAAVVDTHSAAGQVIYVRGHARPGRFQRDVRSLADLAAIAATLQQSDGVTQLWLTPRFTVGRELVGITRAWTPLRLRGEACAVVVPALDRRLSELLATVEGQSLFDLLDSVGLSLGIGVESTPGRTAEALLRGSLDRKGEYAPLSHPSPIPWVTEPVLNWIRPLERDELERATWILAVDRIGAYLHSMLLVDMGVGDPTVIGPCPDWSSLVWTPGYFHARLAPEDTAAYLPDPLHHSGAAGEWEWITTPTLRLGTLLDRVREVDRMVVWTRKRRALAPIAKRIIAARNALPASLRPYGEPLLKRMYKELVGRLRADFHRGTPLYRPDWYALIVADARTRAWRAAFEMAARTRWRPAGMNIDCWYVPWPRVELPPGFDPRHWQIKGAARLSDELAGHFERRELSIVARSLRAPEARRAAEFHTSLKVCSR